MVGLIYHSFLYLLSRAFYLLASAIEGLLFFCVVGIILYIVGVRDDKFYYALLGISSLFVGKEIVSAVVGYYREVWRPLKQKREQEKNLRKQKESSSSSALFKLFKRSKSNELTKEQKKELKDRYLGRTERVAERVPIRNKKIADEIYRATLEGRSYYDKAKGRATRTGESYLYNNYYLPLERELRKIVGQELAKKIVMRTVIKLARERLFSGKHHKPVSFLLVGKTGVGKTELAKRVAEALKGVEYDFFRIDANQLRTAESVQSLFGAPRGYIGSDSVPLFIQKVAKSRGKMVILIDEIEKAHPDFLQAFMTMLDEGEITFTTTGERLKLNDALIFITSNLEAERIAKEVAKVDGEVEKLLRAKELIKSKFLPEILSRINYVIPFENLTPAQYKEIIKLKLSEFGLQSDDETALKLLNYFKQKGVLERGVREMVNAIRSFSIFPEELEQILKTVEPAKLEPEKRPEEVKEGRYLKGVYDPKYGKKVIRLAYGSRIKVFTEDGELIGVE